MASNREDLERNIIPLWRSYDEIAKNGELAYFGQSGRILNFDRFGEYLDGWKEHHTITTAADLINAAVAGDNVSLTEVVCAAEYLCKYKDDCSPLVYDVAKSLLVNPQSDRIVNGPTNELQFDDRASLLIVDLTEQEKKTKARIGLLRKQLRDFCYNAITYCELARCYSDLGLNEKAKHYMLCAVQLAPHNRYVSRCAARFFVHIDDAATAKKILVRNGWVTSDPWLMAAEIAVSTVLKRSSRNIKAGRQLVLSGNLMPYSSSELCFAICKEDYDADKRKDWQKMFRLGLTAPNENSLAQAEYLTKIGAKMDIDYGLYDSMSHKSEADTRNYYALGKYEEAFISSVNWMQDFRFSHEPIAFAFDMSCTFLKKYDYSVAILKQWLETHPQDHVVMNNLIYALGLSDKADEAGKLLSKINVEKQLKEDVKNGICLLATQGLVAYRKNNIEEGRAKYQLSIDTAKLLRKKELAAKARLNMIREEVHCVNNYDKNLLNEIDSLSTGDEEETKQLRKDILLEVEKKTKP